MSIKLTDKEFKLFKEYIHKISGIHMRAEKRVLVESRLAKRLRHFGCASYQEYYQLLQKDDHEKQMFIDIITTNETSFFREPHHFEFLKQIVLPACSSHVRIWSAACSIGAEAYSAAMVCDEILTPRRINFEIACSDINVDVIKTAQMGLYPEKFTSQISQKYLKKYCLRGKGSHAGHFIIGEELKSHLLFRRLNLLEPLPNDMGEFDVIFLRNMLIYFDGPEKKAIVENVSKRLKKGGYLLIGHSESLFNITDCVKQVKPTIYTKL
ncbi:MAG: protein-glutamate O-methyltransferase CheR [Sulfuricurvum sp.]|nr:protein-glutamate O-methyltransferase CheR [Sulfuricurvum sp.]